MTEPSEIGGDVVAGASALAGFILVYLGAIVTSYAGYHTDQQYSVKGAFQRRAWSAVFGIALALASVAAGLAGKWFASERWATVGVYLLFITLAVSLATAVLAALDVS